MPEQLWSSCVPHLSMCLAYTLAEQNLSAAVEALTASLPWNMHAQKQERGGRLWKLQEGQRRPGIELTGSAKNRGHQPLLRTTVYELNPKSATVSHLVFPTACATSQPSRDGERNKPLANALCFYCAWKAPNPSQSITSGHICCVASIGAVRR